MDIIITPGMLRGTLEAPPSKSHAHRLMTAVALAGKKNSESLCTSEDTRATFRCLNELHDGGILDCGESGTTLRFLLGARNKCRIHRPRQTAGAPDVGTQQCAQRKRRSDFC